MSEGIGPETHLARLRFLFGGGRGIGQIGASSSSQFGANQVSGKAGAKEAAIDQGDFAFLERPACVRKVAFDALAHERSFVRVGENRVEGCFDVMIGDPAGAKFPRDAETALSAGLRVLARVVQSEVRVVEVFLFAKTRDNGPDGFLLFDKTLEVRLHFVNGVPAAHQGSQRRSVEVFARDDFA